MRVIRATAEAKGSPLLVQGDDWHIEAHDGGLRHINSDGEAQLPRPSLAGPHQVDNAGAAITILRYLGVRPAALSAALTNAKWPARMQLLTKGPLVRAAGRSELWLDGGHNTAAGLAVARTLEEMPARTNRIVCGMLNTKDISSFLAAIRSVADRLYAVAIPGEEASLPAAKVARAASDVGFRAEPAMTAEEAVRHSVAETPDSRILVCGSLYLAGSILRENA